MLKALGIVMILFASVMFSYMKVDEMKQKYQNLKQMKKALSMMKSEISFSSRELSEAAGELSASLSGDMAFFFKNVSQYLAENETADFGQAWEAAKSVFAQKPFLSAAADKTMTDFSQRAGKMSREIELENIEKTLEAIDNTLEDEREKYTKNRKLIFTLGIAAGLAVLILFV